MIVAPWLAEQVSLDLLAADTAQVMELLFCLDAFGKRLDAEFFCHVDNRREDGLGFLAEAVQEFHVHLELVEIEVLQDVERGIAAAEIVHPNLVAHLVELVHHACHKRWVGAEDRLGNLDVEHSARHLVFVHRFLDDGEDVAKVEVEA